MALIYRFEHYDEPPDARHEEVALLTDQLFVLLPTGHRLARRERLALTDLADEPWVQGVRHGSTLNILPAACAAAGFDPRIAFRTDDVAAVQGFVAAGVGVAVISNLVLPLSRDDLVVRPFGPALRRTVSVALPRSGAGPPAAAAMVEALKAVGDELIAEAGGLYRSHDRPRASTDG